jgi:hypothetical protein
MADINLSWNYHLAIKKQAIADNRQSAKNTGKKKMGLEDLDDDMYGKYSASQLVSPINSIHSGTGTHRTDLSDIGLCSLNIREHSYNSIINNIQLGNMDNALKKVTEELV